MSRARRQQRKRQRRGAWRTEIDRALQREAARHTQPGPERYAQERTLEALIRATYPNRERQWSMPAGTRSLRVGGLVGRLPRPAVPLYYPHGPESVVPRSFVDEARRILALR